MPQEIFLRFCCGYIISFSRFCFLHLPTTFNGTGVGDGGGGLGGDGGEVQSFGVK